MRLAILFLLAAALALGQGIKKPATGGGALGTDSVGTTELDDDANTPVAGDHVIVEAGAASFDYATPNAGTDITADLEEEAHATEHAENAADELLAENLGTACTANQVVKSDGAGGLDCGADAGGGDFALSRNGGDTTILDIAAGTHRINSTVTAYAAATADTSAGTGLAYIYLDATGTLTVGSNGQTIVCTGCTHATPITAYPANSTPIGTWNVTASPNWDAAITSDDRAFISRTRITSPGGTLAITEAAEDKQIDLDLTASNVITGDWDFGGGGIEVENGTTPPACTEGQLYVDTDATSGSRLMACETTTFVTQGGGAAFNPLDEDTFWIRDEFFSGATGGSINGSAGGLGWGKVAVGACGNFDAANVASAWPNYGIYRLKTSTTADQGCVLFPVGIALPFSRFDNVANWELKWIFRMQSTADVRLRVGLCGDGNLATDMLDNFMGVRYDTDAAFNDDVDGVGGNLWVVTRASDVITETEVTATAASTNWVQLRMRSAIAGTIVFNINGGGDITHTTNVPSDEMAPCMHMLTDTTAEKTFDVDFFAMQRTGNTR